MNKQITLEQAVEKVQDGMTIMFGGFLGNGSATQIIDAIVEKGVKDLTIIANDTAYDEVAHGKLVSNHQVKKAIVSHTGTNKQTALQKNEGTLIVEYVPQGTLAERIRAAGAGLGGVLTPTGMGTIMADGKDVVTVDGKDYLLEKPLKADIAFLRANIVDEFGNMVFLGTTNNFNPLMATAADYVVVEAEKLVKVGEIKPECVHASGIYVDGKDYLLEKPLRADIAFLRANIVDEFGNMVFLGTTNNFNPLMATAADYVVVEAEKLVPVGEIAPEHVHASGIYVDGIYVEK